MVPDASFLNPRRCWFYWDPAPLDKQRTSALDFIGSSMLDVLWSSAHFRVLNWVQYWQWSKSIKIQFFHTQKKEIFPFLGDTQKYTEGQRNNWFQLTVTFSEWHGHYFMLKTFISRKYFYYEKQNCSQKESLKETKCKFKFAEVIFLVRV